MAKKKVNLKKLPKVSAKRTPVKKITWLSVLVYIALGYVLMNIVQAIFCGTKAVSVCNAGIWVIPVWIIAGVLLYLKYK